MRARIYDIATDAPAPVVVWLLPNSTPDALAAAAAALESE